MFTPIRPMTAIGWEAVDPEMRAIIQRVCTPKQVEVMKMKAAGFGIKRMAQALSITPEAVRSRLTSAELRVRREVAAMRGVA
jgi:DNA-binding CsgD family transcriptional regulator